MLLVAIAAAVAVKKTVFKPFDLEETAYIYIDGEKEYEDVIAQLKKAGLPSEQLFRILAERMKYPGNVKTGRYPSRRIDDARCNPHASCRNRHR